MTIPVIMDLMFASVNNALKNSMVVLTVDGCSTWVMARVKLSTPF